MKIGMHWKIMEPVSFIISGEWTGSVLEEKEIKMKKLGHSVRVTYRLLMFCKSFGIS